MLNNQRLWYPSIPLVPLILQKGVEKETHLNKGFPIRVTSSEPANKTYSAKYCSNGESSLLKKSHVVGYCQGPGVIDSL